MHVMYVFTCVHMCMQVHMHVCDICVHMCEHVHAGTQACVCDVCVHVCTCMCVMYMITCVHICMQVCMHVHGGSLGVFPHHSATYFWI